MPVPAIWREWAHFVRRPVLPVERQRFGGRAVREVAQLLVLNLASSFVLLILLSWLAKWLGVKTPEFEMLTKRGPLFMFGVGAVAIPLVEELVTRFWLDGRKWHLVLVGAMVGLIASLAIIGPIKNHHPLPPLLLFGGWIVVGLIVAWRSGSGVPAWFSRRFAWFYYASALLFGLAHISNYQPSQWLLAIPFVLPQLVDGLVFGFARVRYGMWANLALHMTPNGLLFGLMLSGL